MEARIQARVHHAIHVGDHRLCLGSRSVVAEWHPGFPSRRRSDAGELAMDLVRHHADEPNPNGDRTTIGRKRLPRTAGKMEQPSCGTDRPGSCSDAIIPVGAGVGRPRPRGVMAAWVWACCATHRRQVVALTKPLREVTGIGAVRAKRITDAWAEQKIVREIMAFLHSNGVGTARAVRLFKTYGADAVQVMTENPYRLARDIRGIGFKSADAIAMRLGIEKTAMIRLRAGISYALTEAMGRTP